MDNAIGTTAKDLTRGSVCVGEAETRRRARELGPAVADAAEDKALSRPELPGLLFIRYPRAPSPRTSSRDETIVPDAPQGVRGKCAAREAVTWCSGSVWADCGGIEPYR